MGFGGIGIWQLLIILVIVVLLFGTKKLRNIGADLGGAIRSFRSSMKEGGTEGPAQAEDNAKLEDDSGLGVDAKVDEKSKDAV